MSQMPGVFSNLKSWMHIEATCEIVYALHTRQMERRDPGERQPSTS